MVKKAISCLEELKGKTITKILGCQEYNTDISLICDNGEEFTISGTEESMTFIDDVIGSPKDILNKPIISIKEHKSRLSLEVDNHSLHILWEGTPIVQRIYVGS